MRLRRPGPLAPARALLLHQRNGQKGGDRAATSTIRLPKLAVAPFCFSSNRAL
jgi:hypothetical protein